jgi:hypothetical protein
VLPRVIPRRCRPTVPRCCRGTSTEVPSWDSRCEARGVASNSKGESARARQSPRCVGPEPDHRRAGLQRRRSGRCRAARAERGRRGERGCPRGRRRGRRGGTDGTALRAPSGRVEARPETARGFPLARPDPALHIAPGECGVNAGARHTASSAIACRQRFAGGAAGHTVSECMETVAAQVSGSMAAGRATPGGRWWHDCHLNRDNYRVGPSRARVDLSDWPAGATVGAWSSRPRGARSGGKSGRVH